MEVRSRPVGRVEADCRRKDPDESMGMPALVDVSDDEAEVVQELMALDDDDDPPLLPQPQTQTPRAPPFPAFHPLYLLNDI